MVSLTLNLLPICTNVMTEHSIHSAHLSNFVTRRTQVLFTTKIVLITYTLRVTNPTKTFTTGTPSWVLSAILIKKKLWH